MIRWLDGSHREYDRRAINSSLSASGCDVIVSSRTVRASPNEPASKSTWARSRAVAILYGEVLPSLRSSKRLCRRTNVPSRSWTTYLSSARHSAGTGGTCRSASPLRNLSRRTEIFFGSRNSSVERRLLEDIFSSTSINCSLSYVQSGLMNLSTIEGIRS